MTNLKKGEVLLLYGTCPDAETAKSIAKALLDARLVACVNILPGMVSLYRWQGQIEEEGEVLFLAKSTTGCWNKVADLFTRLHPYDEPALVALPIETGLEGFLGWVANETSVQ